MKAVAHVSCQSSGFVGVSYEDIAANLIKQFLQRLAIYVIPRKGVQPWHAVPWNGYYENLPFAGFIRDISLEERILR